MCEGMDHEVYLDDLKRISIESSNHILNPAGILNKFTCLSDRLLDQNENVIFN